VQFLLLVQARRVALSAVIATLAARQAAVYLFTEGKSVPRPLMDSFTICVINVPPIFSLGCVKTLWGDAPSLVSSFSAFIVMKHLLFVCRYVEPSRSYALPYGSFTGNSGPKPTNQLINFRKVWAKHMAVSPATARRAAK